MVTFENSYLSMWFDPEVKLLYSEWKRLPTQQEYQDGVKRSEKLLNSYQVLYWIMDSTRLAAMPIEQQSTTLHYMAQVIVTSSIKKLARIVPKDNSIISFFEDTLQLAQKAYNSKIEIDRFNTYKAAADWIGMIGC
ncbi:hypothetical protein FVR03_00645 [Pontibacter qinzhouensis]|uniref:STAS/SEC14 domain-containing protein n=1 Tax=Pontibacter qinzhouensis TaxID=2603253 RepID=A0A5C8KCV3_9BACT|nr:hypothetical protein [Pontibacter qinzhouensis]TXK52598.1 hypothetical protein FVR03_00645 [Pontibacter qinzhouensis]